MEDFLFQDEEETSTVITQKPWKILIVDDDHGVHDITRLALKNLTIQNKLMSFTSVYSAKEARELLEHDDSFAVALIDVVMETAHAGLELTQYIREELLNPHMRIIIRTGQSGQAPEKYVIDHYDINDYKEKTELNADKLYGSVKLAINNYADIQKSNTQKEALYQKIILHPLTNLYNRHKLQDDLLDMQDITFILLNVDRFSHINDLYGYEQGNYILKEIAYVLKLLEKKGNKLYHIGVDEFVLIREDSNQQSTQDLISSIQKKFLNSSFTHDDIDFNITFTIAVVQDETEGLFNKADLSIKEARLISSNRIQFYHQNMKVQLDIQNNVKWFKEIKHAIKEDRLVPYFQAIYNNRTKKIEKYECLVRMLKEDEVISPFAFLTVAEETGLLSDITHIMLEKSAKVFSQNELYFSINITTHDLQDEGFSSFVEGVLKKHNIKPSRLILEILENNSLDSIPNSRKNISQLQEIGCSIALDDFGAKCQNFANILNLQLNSIKIDGYFIKNLKDEMSRKMVDSIVYFANNVGISLVAEFVCDKEIFDIVNELGIEYSQGYYISEPKPDLLLEENPLS
ncbi:EAL domain-containing protein [Sulfurimonas sp. MAG313]|nr:GGDEF and EAL domain-containing protein [Sulfurimonas sp. MAG313]MDF1881343.1 EAL domain-containing protein [Sulfurimonas sp. MAG313]